MPNEAQKQERKDATAARKNAKKQRIADNEVTRLETVIVARKTKLAAAKSKLNAAKKRASA